MASKINAILEALPEIEDKLLRIQESIIANLVMISEIPAPTFEEQRRVEFVVNRFSELNLQNCSTDEKGNALGILPGTDPKRNILVVAHLDTHFPEETDHNVSVLPDYCVGPGICDNALGVASILSLPTVLEEMNIKLNSNLVLMGSSRSLGKGNIEGLRFFVDNADIPINAGVCVEGVQLGRLSYSSIGMLRGEIIFTVPEEYDWTRFGAGGAILNLNDMINNILEIPLPRQPRTAIVLGSVEGGKGYNTVATSASLKFEIRSEEKDIVEDLEMQIENIASEVAARSGSEVILNTLARRKPGGINFSHPLARASREIMKKLGIKPRLSPSTSELSAFIDKQIPAVTIGISNGEHMTQTNETVEIRPIFTGITQLVGMLLALDEENNHESSKMA